MLRYYSQTISYIAIIYVRNSCRAKQQVGAEVYRSSTAYGHEYSWLATVSYIIAIAKVTSMISYTTRNAANYLCYYNLQLQLLLLCSFLHASQTNYFATLCTYAAGKWLLYIDIYLEMHFFGTGSGTHTGSCSEVSAQQWIP